jgi:hypothetical protein
MVSNSKSSISTKFTPKPHFVSNMLTVCKLKIPNHYSNFNPKLFSTKLSEPGITLNKIGNMYNPKAILVYPKYPKIIPITVNPNVSDCLIIACFIILEEL